MKVVINTVYGGYSLSQEAYDRLGMIWDGFGYAYRDDRANERLVTVVEELGEKAWGESARLKVVEIPDDVEWEIAEYDGIEWIAEKHRTWC